MAIPTADDYALAEIDVLATSIVSKLRTMQHRGTGKAAERAVLEMRGDLRELLQDLVNKAMAQADRCREMTADVPLQGPISTRPRRQFGRLTKRKTKSPTARGDLRP